MRLIEVKPHCDGWKVFEAPGVEPVFLKKDQAINYAEGRARSRSSQIRILDSDGTIENAPGSTYTIQVRALGGSTGQSDWSDPSSHMAV